MKKWLRDWALAAAWVLALLVAMCAIITILGYATHNLAFTKWVLTEWTGPNETTTPMALNTAVCFLALSLSQLIELGRQMVRASGLGSNPLTPC